MKTITICLVLMLTCSCCHIADDTHPANTKETMTRHDKIRKIMRDHWIHEYETGDFYWWSAEYRKKISSEFRKMKEDYYYVIDLKLELTIPGPGWVIRGPLTIKQVE